MDTFSVYGKRQLCWIESTDFTDVQGIGKDPMYKRYESVHSVIKSVLGEDYLGFLAQPVFVPDEDHINWYVDEWTETPCRLVDLTGPEHDRYETLLNEKVSKIKEVIKTLQGEDYEILAGATRFINNEYVYCFDGKVVLAVWGMRPDTHLHVTNGSSIVHECNIKKNFRVKFFAGDNGELKVKTFGTLSVSDNEIIKAEDVPEVKANEGFEFIGWMPNPVGYKVNSNTTFIAQYVETVTPPPFVGGIPEPPQPVKEEEKPPVPVMHQVNFVADSNSTLSGDTTIYVPDGHVLQPSDLPLVNPAEHFKFHNWSPSIGSPIHSDSTFYAQCSKASTVNITFDGGTLGKIKGNSVLTKAIGTQLVATDIPTVSPKWGYRFVGWDVNPLNLMCLKDTTIHAKYDKNPWWKNWWWWLLFLLLLLLLLWLLLNMRGCSCSRVFGGDYSHGNNGIIPPADSTEIVEVDQLDHTIPGQDHPMDNNFNGEDNNADILNGDNEIPTDMYDPENPDATTPIHVAPLYNDHGEMVPIEHRNNRPDIVGNRLIVYFDDINADINAWTRQFKQWYPGDEYRVVGFDRNVPYVQISMPESQREHVLNDLNTKGQGKGWFAIEDAMMEGGRNSNTTATTNRPIRMTTSANAQRGWHLNAIRLRAGWAYTQGSPNVKVAIVDDGIDMNHEMFRGRIYYPYNVFRRDNHLSTGTGHGTHVAGLAAGSATKFNMGVSGVAPNVKIMPVQVSDNGQCSMSAIVSGLMYAINKNADVVNFSITTSFNGTGANQFSVDQQRALAEQIGKDEEKLWKLVFKAAKKHKTILVHASGNDNVLAYLPPENRSTDIINVDAVGPNMGQAFFTNFGMGSNVSAPGMGIYSSLPGNRYGFEDGTSMAAPIVAGTVALMRSVDPNITVQQCINTLQATGARATGNVPPIVQVDKALAVAKTRQYPSGPTWRANGTGGNRANPNNPAGGNANGNQNNNANGAYGNTPGNTGARGGNNDAYIRERIRVHQDSIRNLRGRLHNRQNRN